MTRFARLYAAIDGTTSTNAKVAAMAAYLKAAPPRDAAWAVFFLTGRRLKRLLSIRTINEWIAVRTGVSEWLLGECYAVVGDGAETAALVMDVVPSHAGDDTSLAEWVEDRILPLRQLDAAAQERHVLAWLSNLPRWERFALLKLLTGELRVGVSQSLVVRALAEAAALPTTTVAARLMGEWTPTAAWYESLISPDVTDGDRARPYPFCLASPVGDALVAGKDLTDLLGDPRQWLIEWKWDGIRAQLVKRGGRLSLWSRGEELITDRFPEVGDAASVLPDGSVLDGELLAYRGNRPLSFAALQQRIGRQRGVERKVRDIPVVFMAYDILEDRETDMRPQPLASRRARLEAVIQDHAAAAQARAARADGPRARPREALLPFDEDPATGQAGAVLRLSPRLEGGSWGDLARLRRESRERGVEGLMLKRLSSPYGVGRKRGDWWKWKIDPHTIDAVLIYAQPGSGKRASLLTDYTFGVWHNGELVPVAKAYSGLSNDEIAEMDRWIRRHTVERFGPVRHVEPVHVFELGFEAIARSLRHRSGIAVRFPRMLRWRREKPASEADTLDTLAALLPRP